MPDIRKSFENVHLDVKVNWISFATSWNYTTDITLVSIYRDLLFVLNPKQCTNKAITAKVNKALSMFLCLILCKHKPPRFRQWPWVLTYFSSCAQWASKFCKINQESCFQTILKPILLAAWIRGPNMDSRRLYIHYPL